MMAGLLLGSTPFRCFIVAAVSFMVKSHAKAVLFCEKSAVNFINILNLTYPIIIL